MNQRYQAISWETYDTRIKRYQLAQLRERYERHDVGGLLVHPEPDTSYDEQRLTDVFTVCVSGRSLTNKTLCHEFKGFYPYFYIFVTPELSLLKENLFDLIRDDYHFRFVEVYDNVQKTQFVGFHESTTSFIRIECPSKSSYFYAKRFFKNLHLSERLEHVAFRNKPIMLYESMCDPLVQYWIALRIHPMTWFSVTPKMVQQNGVLGYGVQTEFFPTCQDLAPFKTIHYDLECFSSVAYSCGKNQMPNPEIPEDVIIGIGAVITTSTSPEIVKRVYFGIGPINTQHELFTNVNAEVHVFENEHDMLTSFCDFLEEEDPDIWNAFNNFGFDDRYLHKRMELHNVLDRLPLRCAKKINNESTTGIRRPPQNSTELPIQLCQKDFMSNAFQFEANYLHLPLRMYMDLLIFARREFKTELTKFTLENISQVLLEQGKHDVSPQEIFKAWATRSEQGLTEVGAYCIQDCELVAKIMDHKKVYSCVLSRAELFLCDPRDLLLKGQQQIVFNLIFKQSRSSTNFCIPDSADDAVEYELHANDPDSDYDSDDSSEGEEDAGPRKKEKFKGATVLEPKKGAYMAPIAGLDFASLYPSIMVAYNLCHSTKVITPESVAHITNPDHLYTTQLTGGRSTTFVQKDYRRGVLPQILLDLWKQRKVLKKDMARAKERNDVNMTAIYNAKQLAVKMAMNSIYGFCGADNGKLPMKDIAETVTSNGRMLIDRSKNYVESWYPCEVVYGDTDSVYVRFFLDELPEHLRDPKNVEDRTEMLTWVMARSQEAADRITENYISPIELEFEKVMYPFILFKKKRYCCVIYEAGRPDKIDEVCTKGIAVTRRDFAPFVKRVYGTIIDKILLERDINGAFEYAEAEMIQLLNGEYPVEELVVSRSISRKPESYANQNVPHLVLGKRIEERTGVPIKVGDRIQFVFIKGTGRQCDLVEEPQLVNQKQVDGYYYYEHQIHSSLTEMLSVLDKQRWLLLDAKLQRVGIQKSKNLQDITKFFSPSTSTASTTNSVVNKTMQVKKKARGEQTVITSFFVKK